MSSSYRGNLAAWGLVVLSLVATGCAGTPGKVLPAAQVEAIRHNSRGVEEVRNGHLDEAVVEFSDALRLHSSIDNAPGAAVALVNISRASRLKGDTRSAREASGRAEALIAGAPGLAGEVFFEQAKVELAANDLSRAREFALRADKESPTAGAPSRKNLLALVSFRGGVLEEARRYAEKALEGSSGSDNERANSHRLLGEIALAGKEYADAGRHFAEALRYDKNIGAAVKIAEDLRGLSRAMEGKGELRTAIACQERAVNVRRSLADAASLYPELRRLAELLETGGEASRAAGIREELARPQKESGR